MNQGEYFFAAKNFRSRKILPVVEHSAKALLCQVIAFISTYEEAIASLENFLRNTQPIKIFNMQLI